MLNQRVMAGAMIPMGNPTASPLFKELLPLPAMQRHCRDPLSSEQPPEGTWRAEMSGDLADSPVYIRTQGFSLVNMYTSNRKTIVLIILGLIIFRFHHDTTTLSVSEKFVSHIRRSLLILKVLKKALSKCNFFHPNLQATSAR